MLPSFFLLYLPMILPRFFYLFFTVSHAAKQRFGLIHLATLNALVSFGYCLIVKLAARFSHTFLAFLPLLLLPLLHLSSFLLLLFAFVGFFFAVVAAAAAGGR